MNQPIQFSMPVEREEQYESDRSSFNSTVNLYKPLPIKAGERFVNEIFIPLFDPTRWKIFNKSPDEKQALGLEEANPLAPIAQDEPILYSFYFKVPVHNVQNFQREDGSVGFAQVVCPKHFNAYLTKALGRRPLFKEDKCAFCEAANQAWGMFNERWKEIEEEGGTKKSDMTPEGRRSKGEQDPVLKETYTLAKQNTLQEKIILHPFDIGKLKGSRPLEAENEILTYQTWFAPKTVFQNLREQWVEDRKEGALEFFSFYNPSGLQVMKLVKSTEKCRGNNLRDTEYSIFKGSTFQPEESWKAYLSNLDSMPDPSDLLNVVSYEEMALYVQPEDESYNKPVQSVPQAAVPQAAPPQAAPAVPQAAPAVPQAAPPQAAPPQAAPPQAAPPQAAPAVPQAAPPQAAPAVPQAAPQVPPVTQPPMSAPPAVPQAAPQVPPTTPPPQAASQMPPTTPPPQAASQMPQGVDTNPPIASGAAPTAPPVGVPDASTAPDRTPPATQPPRSTFSW